MMKIALTMPQFGESITEALIVRWLKKEGEEVIEREPIIELETEKSVFSYESPFKGKLTKQLQGENQQVAVGTEIAHFEVADEQAKKYLALGIGKVVGGASPAPTKTTASSPSPVMPAATPILSSGKVSGLPPLIRTLAKEKGVPLEEVEKFAASLPNGRIGKEDFLKYLENRQSTTSSREGVKLIPMTPIRVRIAEKMSQSKQEIPHAGTGVDADVTAIDEWRAKSSSKVGHLPFVIVAVLGALKKFPVLNSSLKHQGGRPVIEEYAYVHLGIATATPQGLMVPVLRNAHELTFFAIVEQGTRLIMKARDGKLELSELTGGTFTVNNTGALGAIRSNQVIPFPQSGILAVNRVTKRPWVIRDEIRVRSIMPLDLAFDHRIVDGDAACGFLEEVRESLENFNFSLI